MKLPAAHRLSGLGQRFDGQTLQPAQAGPPVDTRDQAVLRALHAWCLADSGPGSSVWARPLAQPVVGQRLKLATLGPATPRALGVAGQLGLQLDGSLQMAELGTVGRIRLRLQTKLHDAMWWRPLQPADPWDCGQLRAPPAGPLALTAFTPRRPTLIVLAGLAPPERQQVVQTLQQRQAAWAHAVRVLVVADPAEVGLPAQRFVLEPEARFEQAAN
jgi:hypothetical protein